MATVKVVLKRPFLGPDGVRYPVKDAFGKLIKHEFNADWILPSTVRTVSETGKLEPINLSKASPKTLKEIAALGVQDLNSANKARSRLERQARKEAIMATSKVAPVAKTDDDDDDDEDDKK